MGARGASRTPLAQRDFIFRYIGVVDMGGCIIRCSGSKTLGAGMGKRGASLKYAWVLAGACVPLASLALATDSAQSAPSAGAQKTFTDMVNSRCEKCHNADDWAGSLAMDTLDLNQVGQNPEVWEKAIAKLGSR